MTYIERGLYRDLLDECWAEGGIPDDIEELADICGCPVDVMANAWQVLSRCFETSANGFLVNRRLDSERTAKDVERASRQIAGAIGGKKKSEKSQQNQSDSSTCQASASTCHIELEEKENRTRKEKPMSADADSLSVFAVFDHWRVRMNHPNAKLDDKRRKLIQKALKLGYTAAELIEAIDGCAKSPFHMGQNERSTVYDGLDLILRDASKIDGFIKHNSLPAPQQGGTYANNTNTDRVRNLSRSAAGRVQLNAERELAQIEATRKGAGGAPLADHDQDIRPQVDIVVR